MNTNTIKDVCAVIPALNPDTKFLKVVNSLVDAGFEHIIIVDDGSDEAHKSFFERATEYPQCCLLKHARNLGKGRALKTAFNHFLNEFGEMKGIVTVDADDQHHIEDIIRCSLKLLEEPDALILGSRDFKGAHVPRANKMGNRITSFVMTFLCGIRISDTQTGLRAMSGDNARIFLDIAGERFEYETNMLIETKRQGIRIVETPIRTVYIEQNRSSHFNPLIDSFRIYVLILKYLSASLGSVVIDLSVFTVMMMALKGQTLEIRVPVSTVTARIASSLFNYSVNRKYVFRSEHSVSQTILKYYLLAGIQILLSTGGVYLLVRSLPAVNSTFLKACVDTILFFVSFQIQREWVFRNKINK